MDSIWSKIEKIAEENHGVIKTSAVEAEAVDLCFANMLKKEN